MDFFPRKFKLYTYKQHDRCDLSIRVNECFVTTFRLTRSELESIFSDYATRDSESNRYGVQFTSQAGQHWFVMNKRNRECVRVTVGNKGVDYNFRISYSDWDWLIQEYDRQKNSSGPEEVVSENATFEALWRDVAGLDPLSKETILARLTDQLNEHNIQND